MENVIQIGEARLTRRQQTPPRDECQHSRMTIDDHGEIITCDDCSKQLSAFWVLCRFGDQFKRAKAQLDAQRAAHADAVAKGVTLKSAQEVESAWRSRSMVPTCPHCREAIFATDGFGRAQINKEIATRRRQTQLDLTRTPA
jgi:ribosomal protein S27E